MTNDISTIETNHFLQVAAETSGGALGKLLKFNKGKYFIGDDNVTDQERIAHVEATMRGYVKFVEGKVAAQNIGRIADGFKLPLRDDLGDTDQTKWDRDSSGKPRDPWSLQYYLPLEDIDSGDVAVFVTGSKGGIGAIGKLCDLYARNVRRGSPVIKLGVRSYRHNEFGRIETPDFVVVSWGAVDAGALPVANDAPTHRYRGDPISTGRPRGSEAMSDDIPF